MANSPFPDISLELARSDDPYFRASLQRLEDDVDLLYAWTETASKSLKILAEETIRKKAST